MCSFPHQHRRQHSSAQDTSGHGYSPDPSSCGQKGLGSRLHEEHKFNWSQQVSAVSTTRWLQTLPLSARDVACKTVYSLSSLVNYPGQWSHSLKLTLVKKAGVISTVPEASSAAPDQSGLCHQRLQEHTPNVSTEGLLCTSRMVGTFLSIIGILQRICPHQLTTTTLHGPITGIVWPARL